AGVERGRRQKDGGLVVAPGVGGVADGCRLSDRDLRRMRAVLERQGDDRGRLVEAEGREGLRLLVDGLLELGVGDGRGAALDDGLVCFEIARGDDAPVTVLLRELDPAIRILEDDARDLVAVERQEGLLLRLLLDRGPLYEPQVRADGGDEERQDEG